MSLIRFVPLNCPCEAIRTGCSNASLKSHVCRGHSVDVTATLAKGLHDFPQRDFLKMESPHQRFQTQCISLSDDGTGSSCSTHEMEFSKCTLPPKKHRHVISISIQDVFLPPMYAYGGEREEDRRRSEDQYIGQSH